MSRSHALLLVCCCPFALLAQSHTWSFALGGASDDNAQSVALDAYGHVYLASFLSATTVDMDPGPGIDSVAIASSTLACYDTDRNYRWSYAFGSGGFQTAHLATDARGSVIIAGSSFGGDLDPGPAVVNAQTNGPGNMVVAKYDSSGAYLWSFNFGTFSTANLAGVGVDSTGNVYVSGVCFSGTDFDPGPPEAIPFSYGGSELNFLAKYDANGNYVWARTMDGPSFFRGAVVAVDPAGNAFLSGSLGDSLNMDPGVTDFVLNSIGPVEDVYLARYRPDGSFQWAGRIAGSLDGYDHAIATYAGDRVVIAGTFRGTYDFDMSTATSNLTATIPGAYDAYVASYDSLGALQWARRYGSSGLDKATCVALDAIGDVTVGGYYAGSITLNDIVDGYGWDDVFVARIDYTGDLLWGFGVGSNDYDDPTALAVGSDGSTYITGRFSNTIDLDPGTGDASHTSAALFDTFLARYDGTSTAMPVANASEAPLTVAPNPLNNSLAVHSASACTFQLFDVTGHCLQRGRLLAGPNTLNVEALAPGIYLLRTKATTVRVVKER
jgi:hypothetical protein